MREKQNGHEWTYKEWLDSGGAEIVLEVVRHIGWTVDVIDAEEWQFLPEIVSIGYRKEYEIWINGAMAPWQQAVAAVAVADSHFKRIGCSYKECLRPVFHDGEMPDEFVVAQINEFIDRVRSGSEATVAQMRAGMTVGK